MTPDQKKNFTINLRALSAEFGSISAVSRQANINRQQFNKYLSGKSRPSAQTLDRLSRFFSVSNTELLLPPERLTELRQRKSNQDEVPEPLLHALPSLFARTSGMQETLSGYCGTYYSYIAAKNNEGLYRTLLQIYAHQGHIYSKELQVFSGQGERNCDYPVHKFSGILYLSGHRLHLVSIEHPESSNTTLAMSIFYASTYPKKDLLIGKIVTVSNFWSRRINSSAHILEYAGSQSPTKAQLKRCGYFEPDDPAVSELVRNRVFSDD
jgi:transcriptional regulator with XRE-family HTH domain